MKGSVVCPAHKSGCTCTIVEEKVLAATRTSTLLAITYTTRSSAVPKCPSHLSYIFHPYHYIIASPIMGHILHVHSELGSSAMEIDQFGLGIADQSTGDVDDPHRNDMSVISVDWAILVSRHGTVETRLLSKLPEELSEDDSKSTAGKVMWPKTEESVKAWRHWVPSALEFVNAFSWKCSELGHVEGDGASWKCVLMDPKRSRLSFRATTVWGENALDANDLEIYDFSTHGLEASRENASYTKVDLGNGFSEVRRA